MNTALLILSLIPCQVKVINFDQRTEVTVIYTADPDDYVVVDYSLKVHAITGYSVLGHGIGKIEFHDLPEFENIKPIRSNIQVAPIRVQYLDGKRVKIIIPANRFTCDLEIHVWPHKKKMTVKATVVTVTEEEIAIP